MWTCILIHWENNVEGGVSEIKAERQYLKIQTGQNTFHVGLESLKELESFEILQLLAVIAWDDKNSKERWYGKWAIL